ncbi:hypothetical protein [Pseudophaeobacter sp.]|uniref:hypothetical protein n=1 Tax=Pseudophaeobacter sp. TaxID=1971739 RepID=UPI0040589D65
MTQTIFDLLKALMNATLLLLALCLFLGWQLFASAREVTDRLGEISENLIPLHSQLQTVTQEVSLLRQALDRSNPADRAEIRKMLSLLETQLAAIKGKAQALQQLPAQLVSTSVESAIRSLSQEIDERLPRLSSCSQKQTALLE